MSATTRTTPPGGAPAFGDEERAAMKERSREVKAAKGRGSKADLEPEVLAKIAELGDPDRALAQRIHELIREVTPQLAPRTWYGMPAYARDGAVVVFFQPAEKFKARYATLGFNDGARLDDGTMWPTAFALTSLTPQDEDRIRELVSRAAG
jgi:uncharacterized protein YdhG (YjbR/CyaY superfamily)